jgi:uroporphyrinogen decarboxylase
MELLSDFVEMGIDALHPIEKAAGNDIVEIKNQYKDDLVLIGNVPIPLLTHGTPKENYEYVKYLLKNVSSKGGHIISSSHSVTQWCKLKNFYAYYKAVKDFGQYPIKIS